MDGDYVSKEVCGQKHETSARDTELNRKQIKEHEDRLNEADIRFAELSGDVKHIKERIDNGLSKTIYEIKDKMEEFMPLVKESAEWAGRFKQAVYFVAVVSFSGGLISLGFHLVTMITEKLFN